MIFYNKHTKNISFSNDYNDQTK